MSDLIGVVLAGGKSERMGQDKAEMMLEGETLLERSTKLLQQAGVESVLISRQGKASIEDLIPNTGPLGGIYSVLTQTHADLLVIPVDMPLLTAESLRALLIPDYPIVHFSSYPLPLFVKNSKTAKHYLQRVLQTDESDKSIMAMVKYMSGYAIPSEHSEQFVNLNTPSDYQKIRSCI